MLFCGFFMFCFFHAEIQEEAFLETVKGLEERAARAETMQDGERATREV